MVGAAREVLPGTARHAFAAIATGAFFGIGGGILFADGQFPPIIVAAGLAVGLAAMARAIVPTRELFWVVALVELAFALRVSLAVTLWTASLTLGCAGFVTGDDAAYANLAWAFASYIQGNPLPPYVPPHWSGEAYLFGTFVYLESAIFLLFGPHVLAVEILNGGLAAALAILTYEITLRLFDVRPARLAATLVAFYPSLLLWSSLNLKDALVLFLTAAFFLTLLRFQRRPHPVSLVTAALVLVPMESLRPYVYTLLGLTLPVSVLGSKLTPHGRVGAYLVVGLTTIAVLMRSPLVPSLPGLFETLEQVRMAMATGARTAFQGPAPIPVTEGETFVVTVSASVHSPGVPARAREVLRCQSLSTILPSRSPGPREEMSRIRIAPAARDTLVSDTAAPTLMIPSSTSTPSAGIVAASPMTSAPLLATPRTPSAPTPALPSSAVLVASPLAPTPPANAMLATAPPRSPAAATAPTQKSPMPPAQTAGGAEMSSAPVSETPGGANTGLGAPVAAHAEPRSSVIGVPPGSRVAIAPSGTEPPPQPGVYYVRPGDVVVVTRGDSTPAPGGQRRELVLTPPTAGAVGPHSGSSGSLVSLGRAGEPLHRTITYLPTGLVYALLAPFPWKPERVADVLTVPDMLLWYLALPAAIWTAWSRRRLLLPAVPMLLFVAGALVAFALAEGNVGTLYRHRAMVVPFVVIIASPGLSALLGHTLRLAGTLTRSHDSSAQ